MSADLSRGVRRRRTLSRPTVVARSLSDFVSCGWRMSWAASMADMMGGHQEERTTSPSPRLFSSATHPPATRPPDKRTADAINNLYIWATTSPPHTHSGSRHPRLSGHAYTLCHPGTAHAQTVSALESTRPRWPRRRAKSMARTPTSRARPTRPQRLGARIIGLPCKRSA